MTSFRFYTLDLIIPRIIIFEILILIIHQCQPSFFAAPPWRTTALAQPPQQPERRVPINRYFLQIDNVFEYKAEELAAQGKMHGAIPSYVESDWIAQPLDHFNPLEEHSFWQRYFYADSNQCPKGKGGSKCPICLFIGGDTAIDYWWLEHTFLAKRCLTEMKGKVFLLEHRFYGLSYPTNATSVRNLQYLTVSQSLEDIATFIVFIRRVFNLERNKLFVFGASYGGTLAALFRRKYPHLAFAAVAFSAPMYREYQDKDYFTSLGKKLKSLDNVCYKQIELGLRQAHRLMETHICSKQEYPMCKKIKENFGLCSSLKGMTKMERRVFFSTFIKDFALVGEYDGVLNVTLQDVCDVISHREIDDWSPMGKLLAGDRVISTEVFRSKTRTGDKENGECIQAKKQIVCDYLRNDNDHYEAVRLGKRQRMWQKCTELGLFRTSSGDAKNHPFGGPDVLPASFQQEFCLCAFGPRYSHSYTLYRIENYVKQFGSFSPSTAGSRIIYTIGEDDPALQRELKIAERMGPNKSKLKTENDNIIFRVKGSSHCGEVFLKATSSTTEINRTRRIMRIKRQQVLMVQQEVVHQLLQWLR